MKKNKIILTKGLQGSGKTTWAINKVKEDNFQTVNINKDDLRAMLNASVHSKGREDFIIKAQEALIELALNEHKNVILSDTNLNPMHIKRVTEKFGERANVVVDDQFMKVPIDECIQRDLKRFNSVGEAVIRSTYKKWVQPKEATDSRLNYSPHDPSKTNVYVFDIDGTLTLGPKNRSPYDFTKVSQDEVNPLTKKMNMLCSQDTNAMIFIVSAREDSCKDDTVKWLEDNGIIYHSLLMRKTDDKRADDIVKEEIINKIQESCNIIAWFDDRLRVCKMVHSKGIPLLRVGDPEADF